MNQLAAPNPPKSRPPRRRRAEKRATSLFANGEPMVWLTGGALAIATVMIAVLLGLVLFEGLPTFWPGPIVEVELADGRRLAGELAAEERFVLEPKALADLPEARRAQAEREIETEGGVRRRMLRTGNYELTGTHFEWANDSDIVGESKPEWMLVVERLDDGRFYGVPRAVTVDGVRTEGDPATVWDLASAQHDEVRERWERGRTLKNETIGAIHARIEGARLRAREIELENGVDSPQAAEARAAADAIATAAESEFREVQAEINKLQERNKGYSVELETASGARRMITLEEIVRAFAPNRLSLTERLGVYVSRASEFLLDAPRQANSEGGVYPAIFGTVLMTLIMALLVVPFGVLAALYLREYARPGPIVSAVRIAINNLAGVPSIVFGVFGLGFFCYIVGAGVDEALFAAKLPTPTYGKGGLLWASLTLALLTLPVVIVPTEEALASVPGSMREGSYACGATKWQTIWRIVLPRAMPGIMTGMILALARGAGEVAPLMLVGAVKFAPDLPLDGAAPFLHPERSFMHLGFHIYDIGFQSQNSEAAKPMVFTTTLLLIALVVLLNVLAIWIRARLRRRFQGNTL